MPSEEHNRGSVNRQQMGLDKGNETCLPLPGSCCLVVSEIYLHIGQSLKGQKFCVLPAGGSVGLGNPLLSLVLALQIFISFMGDELKMV